MKKLVALLLTFLLVLMGCKSIEITRVEDDNNTDSIRFSKEYEMNNTNNIIPIIILSNQLLIK